MNEKSITAMVSAFARAYHATNNDVKVFDDSAAQRLLSKAEYNNIARLISGNDPGFFDPDFKGSPDEALRMIVDSFLSPTPLGRAAFAESELERAAAQGASQYLIFAVGYDTFAYRQPEYAKGLRIFEIDHPATSRDKRQRVADMGMADIQNLCYVEADLSSQNWAEALLGCPSFDRNAVSFCSLLGLSYYLPKEAFEKLLVDISELVPMGSSIVFDYPDECYYSPDNKHAIMAANSGEAMQASYSFPEMEALLARHGFTVREHMTPDEITDRYFSAYNKVNPEHLIQAGENVNYCMGVKL